MQVVVDNASKSFGVHQIFSKVQFDIEAGEHFGLVGVNGSGKSTLISCLLNPSLLDEGTVKYDVGVRIGYVEQSFSAISSESIWNFMLGSCRDIVELQDKMHCLEEQIAQAEAAQQEELLLSYTRAENRFKFLDGYNYEANIKKVLIGLGFNEQWWSKNAATLSGGQKTRLLLCKALVNSPDFLILDEPTNHLDIQMTEWLEEYLRGFKGGLLVVSHDRFFLDNVVDHVMEMEAGHLHVYRGNYSHYLEQKAIEIVTASAAYTAQQEYIAKTEAYIRRFKAGIKSKMARGRQSQLDRLERIDAPVQDEEFELRLPPAPESANKVIMLEDLTVGYGDKPLVKNINLIIEQGEKVALLGANGAGKTTLLKTILQEIVPLQGKAKIGNRVQIGYFSQSYERLDPNQTIMDNFLQEYGYTDEYTRKLLGGMLFRGEEVFKTIGSLSGGQKARLVLLKLALDGANLLLLDEPTNHLDILAKEAVEAALAIFNGTVLLVSHDRYLVNEIASRIWEIKDGNIHDYKGNYDFYLAERSKIAAAKPALTTVTASKQQRQEPAPSVTKQQAKVDKKRYTPQEAARILPVVELRIREQEALQKVMEQKLADPSNQQDLATSQRMADEYSAIKMEIDKLMEQWETVMECLE